MTKEQIIWGMAIAIISAIFSVVLTIILSIYAKEHIPNTKTLNSYIRNFLFNTFRYILPISVLIFVFIHDDFSKLFIIKILILTSVLIIGVLADIVNYCKSLHEMSKFILESHEQTVDIIKLVAENNFISNKETINLISDINKEYLNQIEIINDRIEIERSNSDKSFNKIKIQLKQAPNR